MAEEKSKVVAGVVGAAVVGIPIAIYYTQKIKQLEADLAACTTNVGAYTQSLIEANATIASLEADLNVCLTDKEILVKELEEANATIKLLSDENNSLALENNALQETLKKEHEMLYELACRTIREINASRMCIGLWGELKEHCEAIRAIEKLLYTIQDLAETGCPVPIRGD